MDNVTFKMMELIVSLVSLLICVYVLPILKAKKEEMEAELEAEIGAEKLADIIDWINIFVQAAEQKLGAKTGKDKKALVLKWLAIQCNNIGFNLSEDQAEALIESAVYMLNVANKKEGK